MNARNCSLRLAFLPVLLVGGCGYSGDFLFPNGEIPAIYEIQAMEGGPLVPAVITSRADVEANTIYGEVGASITTAPGGVTFTFIGTGRQACVWVDPESVYWLQAVSPLLDPDFRRYQYPDNPYDDGDQDATGGLSVYYTGGPEQIGDFKVAYEDSLGNPVDISLSVCDRIGYLGQSGAHSGRGTAEWCTIPATDVGISYTVLLETWSTPLDDDRLGFGMLLADGPCDSAQGASLKSTIGLVKPHEEECLIRGEAIAPNGQDFGPWYGFDNIAIKGGIEQGLGFLDIEDVFCEYSRDGRMDNWCEDEAAAVLAGGDTCDYTLTGLGTVPCYCGDPLDTPEPGGG